MIEIFDIEELCEKLRTGLEENHYRLISIDGKDGAGKSTISENLGKQLTLPVIHLDAFLDDNKGSFLKYIDYRKLEQNIRQLLKAHTCILVEGVCVLAVLDKIGIQPDCKIYVLYFLKPIHYFDDADTAEERIKIEEMQLEKFAPIDAELEGIPYKKRKHILTGLPRDPSLSIISNTIRNINQNLMRIFYSITNIKNYRDRKLLSGKLAD